jgi:uncharacterized protein (TIGR02466 family)
MKVQNQTMSLCFPIPIWRLEFADFESVNDEIRRQLAELDWDKLDRENRAVYDSLHTFSEDRFVSVDDLPSIQVVLEYFVSCCNAIAEERNWDMTNYRIALSSYWIHATNPGELTQSHTHKPAILSGVYYVDKPEDSGDLVFVDINPYHEYNPNPLKGESDPIASPQIMFKADEGTMLVFPSWLPHKVPINTSDRRRVSISFNAKLMSKDE